MHAIGRQPHPVLLAHPTCPIGRPRIMGQEAGVIAAAVVAQLLLQPLVKPT